MTDRTPTEPTPESERDFLMWAIDCLMEINPSNYDHDDVCAMNSASVEVSLAMQARLSALAASPAAPGAEVEPVAWGEFYGGRCAAVRLDRSVHCQTPLYLSPPTTDAIRAQARREALEEAAAWHDDQAALHDAQGEACGMGSDGWKRHTVAAADHRRSATSIRALAGKGEAER